MHFQTPMYVCDYMVSLLPKHVTSVLEPTPGEGNLVRSLNKKHFVIDAPQDFFTLPSKTRYDAIVMNPPFTPMSKGYLILFACLDRSNIIIALMPWLTLINSSARTGKLVSYGLKSITHLPRNVFKGSRVQTCIIELYKGFDGVTTWIDFESKEKV